MHEFRFEGGSRQQLLSLVSLGSGGARLTKTSDTNNEEMSLISEINTSMCGKVEIFDAIAAISDVDATGNDRKPTAMSQLRRHLELENQKLRTQDRTKPKGVRTESIYMTRNYY